MLNQFNELLDDGYDIEAAQFIEDCADLMRANDIKIDGACQTLYVNSISLEDQPEYPGDIEIENKIQDIIRWNAMAMVVKAIDKMEI